MDLGSQNTFTFLPPRHWWMRPFRFIAKCQKLTAIEQLRLGVGLIDVRIRFDFAHRKWVFAHGLMTFSGDVFDELSKLDEFCRSRDKRIFVRLILERSRPDGPSEEMFKIFAQQLMVAHSHLRYFGFNRKCDWQPLMTSAISPSYVERVASTNGPKIDALWPWLYARRHNRLNLELLKETNEYEADEQALFDPTSPDFLCLDFIGLPN